MPTKRAATLALALALLAPGAVLEPALFGALALGNLLLLALVVADGLLAVPPRALKLARTHPSSALQMASMPVSVAVDNPTSRHARVTIHDAWPGDVVAPGARSDLKLPGKGAVEVAYDARFTRRGDRAATGVHVTSRGPLGLFQRISFVALPTSLKVLVHVGAGPNAAVVARRMLRRQLGLHRARVRGVGREFDSLRAYVPGDEPRHVDWKVSARRGSLVTREYATERDQTVVLMVDCGRMMGSVAVSGSPDDRLAMTRLDHALGAAMALARAASDAGDQTALALFSSDVHVFLEPGRGADWIARASALTYRRQADASEPDYPRAYALVRRRIRHRALIITFTDVADTEQSRIVVDCNLALRPRYLPLLVTFEDAHLHRVAAAAPKRPEQLYEKAAALEYLEDVRRILARLERQGAQTLQVSAERMAAAVLQKYLDLKLGGRL